VPSGSDVSLVSQRWLDAGCRLDEPSRRAVVSAVMHEIERQGEPSTTWIDQLYAFDPTLSPTTGDVHHLRLVLREVISDRAAPEDAARLQHRAAIVVDDLVGAITQRRLDALEQTARVDALTSLGNRRAGEEALQRAIAHARRRERPLAVAMLDLDGLKQINDTEGHLAGDDALRALGASLAEGMRTEDAAYRFGGDEFVVVAPETSAEELRIVLERIRQSSPSFSIGVAELGPGLEDSAALLAAADDDLYRGRRDGAAAVAAVAGRRGRGGLDPVVPLFALAVGVAAALSADGVRRIAGIEIADQRGLWLAALAATPVVLVAASLRHGGARGAQVRHVLRSGGVAVLALVAALTPLVSGTIERRAAPRRDDPERSASPPTTIERDEDDVATTTTTTTITVTVGAEGSRETTASRRVDVRPAIPTSPITVGLRPVIVPEVVLPPAVRPPVTGVLIPLAPVAPRQPDTEAAGQPPAPTPAPQQPNPPARGDRRPKGPPSFARADERGRGAGPERARQRAGAGADPHPGKGRTTPKGTGGRNRA
jgi:diguanylate cyclase (GGDEF)-like protein